MKTKKIREIFITLCMVTIFANLSFADDMDTLTHYLRGLKNVSMDFTQYDAKGDKAKGSLLLLKPYNFRLNYCPPFPLLIVGNKKQVVMYDYELETTSRIDREENIFNFILTDEDNLNKEFNLQNILNESDRKTFVLKHQTSDRMVSITMKKYPKKLISIVIDEADGNVIEIDFSDIREIKSAPNHLFTIPNPDIYGAPKRFSAKDLQSLVE